ncbi:hypothetical protein [Eubacterium sp.]
MEGHTCFSYIGTKQINSDSYSQGVRKEMHWISIKDLNKYKAFPTFLKEYLSKEHSGIEHIITDERK